jgi:hypothetical protein
MGQEEFSQHFSKSPMKRTKLAGLKRNVKAMYPEGRTLSPPELTDGLRVRPTGENEKIK